MGIRSQNEKLNNSWATGSICTRKSLKNFTRGMKSFGCFSFSSFDVLNFETAQLKCRPTHPALSVMWLQPVAVTGCDVNKTRGRLIFWGGFFLKLKYVELYEWYTYGLIGPIKCRLKSSIRNLLSRKNVVLMSPGKLEEYRWQRESRLRVCTADSVMGHSDDDRIRRSNVSTSALYNNGSGQRRYLAGSRADDHHYLWISLPWLNVAVHQLD